VNIFSLDNNINFYHLFISLTVYIVGDLIICRLDILDITCLTLIVFVIVAMNEIVSLVPRALYLIDWTAVSGA
jgi:hypothetical protein